MADVCQPGRSSDDREDVRREFSAAKQRGLDITGPDGLLMLLTKTVLETALEEEMTELDASRTTIEAPGTAVPQERRPRSGNP
jgi:hypothetical protein